MDKKAYLYIVEAGQFSFEVEIKELLGPKLRPDIWENISQIL